MKKTCTFLLLLSLFTSWTFMAGCSPTKNDVNIGDTLDQPINDIQSDTIVPVPSDPMSDPTEEQVNDELNAILDEIDNDSYEDDLTVDDLQFE